MQSWAWSFPSSFSYFRRFSFAMDVSVLRLLLPAAAERAVQLRSRPQLGASRLRQEQLLLEEVLIRVQDFDVARETRVVARAREIRGVAERVDRVLTVRPDLGELLDPDERVGDLAIPIERRLLIIGERDVEPRLRRLQIAPQAARLEDRLEEARRQRPHGAVAAEELRDVAAQPSEKSGQADRRKEERLRGADVGVGRDEQLLRLDDVRPPLEERGG